MSFLEANALISIDMTTIWSYNIKKEEVSKTMKYHLANTEREIMNVLWKRNEPSETRELLSLFNECGKNWKRQTLNTLLFRLEQKGLVKRVGRTVSAVCTETGYRQLQSREVLQSMYDGKVSNFISALSGESQISKEDETELNRLIEDLKL